ncbi:MAG: hypothetical protein II800_00210 [Lachnospiraceae bacterium]|nr:hypothetical protein [Lachnospiraceae bacterium]
MISCPNCGGNPRFDIASQKLLCQHCGASFDVETFPEEETGAKAQEVTGEFVGDPDKMQVTIYTCSQCGGELMSTDSDATAFCSYCGSHQILEERLSVQERPRRIIPFKITKEDCKKAYAGKLKRNLFAPKELKDPAHIDEFRGIYMPYWSYDFRQQGTLTLNGSTEHREGNYRIIDSYHLTVDADNTFRGITHDASTSFDDKMSESLAPYDTRATVPFRTPYLSGFYADIPDVDKTTYEQEAALMAARDTLEKAKDIPDFRQYEMKDYGDAELVNRTNTSLESVESAMLPVWFLSYRNGDRVAYAAINGQTGKMTADIPIARVRYLAGVAIVAALLWIVLQTFNISSLRGTVLATVFGAMAGGLVYGMIVHKLDENEQNRLWEERMRERMRERNAKASGQAPDPEDKEKKSKKKKNQLPVQKASGAVGVLGTLVIWLILIAAAGILTFLDFRWAVLIEPLLVAGYVQLGFTEENKKKGQISNWALCATTLLGVLIWLINPYVDSVYYGSCVLMMVCVVWCFFDALYYYNQLMTRPLPQFNKKGGDDRA